MIKHRKNLPSLNNGTDQNGRTSTKGNSRGISNDSSVPMAIQIQNSAQNTNGSGFLPGNSRENSQASGSHYSKNHYGKNTDQSINIQQVNAHLSGHGGSSSNRNSSQNQEKTTTASGSNNKSQSQNKEASTRIDDTILQERDQLIKYIKQYIKKNNELPPTTLNFYKFVKLIGKGAFGKVTLGIHKLTGK